MTTMSRHDDSMTYLCPDSDGDKEITRLTVEDKGSQVCRGVGTMCVVAGGSRYRFRPNHHH